MPYRCCVVKIFRALISVSDKTGLVDFAKKLHQKKIQIISTGGTAKCLKEHAIPHLEVSEYTGFPEILDGRVKTLHSKIHAGILADRKNRAHMKKLDELGIPKIDLVVVNLYPFEQTIAKEQCAFIDAVEQIDIGGPTLLRAAAKNYENVVVVCNPSRYQGIAQSLPNIPTEQRLQLALEVFNYTAHYDTVIANYIDKEEFPHYLQVGFDKLQDLRYGENPHQRGAFYREALSHETSISTAHQLHGKQLSFNNIIDANNALELVKEFDEPTVAIIKHTNPCGVASAKTIDEAFRLAHAADVTSAYGSIVALNEPCTVAVADCLHPLFIEVVIASSFDKKALDILMKKKNLRLLETGKLRKSDHGYDMKKVVGGLLVQTRSYPSWKDLHLNVVTKRSPTKNELRDLEFAWKINKYVKSNSVVYVKNCVAVGVGAGQMSRVDSAWIAARKAGECAKGAVMSSDAFFPFRDGIDEAAKAGITAIVQPGGSIRDEEVIAAANQHNMAMVFTGVRLFTH